MISSRIKNVVNKYSLPKFPVLLHGNQRTKTRNLANNNGYDKRLREKGKREEVVISPSLSL